MRKYVFVIIFFLIGILITSSCVPLETYETAIAWLQTKSSHGNYEREIGTNKDLWLNGYLGIFLRFSKFGMINWLVIPIIAFFLITIKRRNRWEIALFFALCMAIIFICITGSRNYRYQLTLLPALNAALFLFGYKILSIQKKVIFISVAVIVVFLIVLSYHSSWKNYQYYYRSAIGNGVAGEGFPFKLVEYINENVRKESVVLELNQPILYYYTNKKGVSVRNKHVRRLINKKKISAKDAFWEIKDSLKVSFVLIRGHLSGRLKDIIKLGGELVCEDQGYKLYKIKDKPDNSTIADFKKRAPDFETDFSKWIGNQEVKAKDLSKALFPLEILGIRGEFIAKRMLSDDGNTIRMKMKKANFNERPEIQFGYFIQPERLNLELKSGDLINFIARIRIKGSRKVGLYIQDKTDYWSREREYWAGKTWKDILIKKTLRDGFNKVCFGIDWKPESEEEWLDVSSIRVFIEKGFKS